jgi:predicted Zn-dependent protease with MMP-like domain
MRLLPSSMKQRLPFGDEVLGFALLPAEGELGNIAGVFWDDVERLAKESNVDRYQILAHAIAHEIGHLLLRTLNHVDAGLMRAHWGPEDLQLACRGLLLLGPREAARLRDEVRTQAASRQVPMINITIKNDAQVPDTTLEEAQGVVTRILSIAGIKTRWRQCGETRADSKVAPNSPIQGTARRIDLHIIPRAMAAYWASRTTSLGLAMIPGEGKRGERAYVFYHRVEEVAATGEASAGQILGHAMAHEIGHLLLNSTAHSGVGIMQAEWHKGQMQLLRNGWLLFTGMQSHKMRAEVLVRETEPQILQAANARN